MRKGAFNDWARGLARTLRARVFDFTGSIAALVVVATMLVFGRARIREGWESEAGPKPSPGAFLEHESDGTFTNQIAFSPDGSRLAVSTISGFVSIRELATGRTQTLQRGPVGSIRQLLFAPDSRSLIYAGSDSVLRGWDWETGVVSELLRLDTDAIRCVAGSRDGTMLAAGANIGHFVDLVRRNDGGQPQVRLGLRGPVNQVAFSPDGQRLAGGDAVGTLVLWDRTSGRIIASVQAAAAPLRDVIFSPDGSRLLTLADQDRVVRIWDPTTGVALGTYPAAPVPINAIACSVDGSMVAAARSDGAAVLLDAASGRNLGTIRVGRHLNTIAFSPDGRIVATGGADGVVRLWSLTRVLGPEFSDRSRPVRASRIELSPEKDSRDTASRDDGPFAVPARKSDRVATRASDRG